MLKSTVKFSATLFLHRQRRGARTHGAPRLAAGWAHPFLGPDHLLAMVAVGLWAAQCGGRRVWLLPATFMVTLGVGGAISMQWQYPLPMVETGIALSVLALGVLIALSLKFPVAAAMSITALFGLLHGYAHGLELPSSAAPVAYAAGFLAGTAVLHLSGIAVGVVSRQRYRGGLARIGGAVIAMSGIGLLTLS